MKQHNGDQQTDMHIFEVASQNQMKTLLDVEAFRGGT